MNYNIIPKRKLIIKDDYRYRDTIYYLIKNNSF